MRRLILTVVNRILQECDVLHVEERLAARAGVRPMISRTNAVLAGFWLIVMMLAAWTRVDYSRPNYEILPDMKYTSAWTAFSANPNFNNRRTLQAPVPGTIARGHLPLHYGATKEDADSSR